MNRKASARSLNPETEENVSQFLKIQKWPLGLQEEYLKGLISTYRTYFLVDNSGSMTTSDSTRFIKSGAKYVPVTCARYAELQESVAFHANLANIAKHATEFRLLSGARPIPVGGSDDDGTGYEELLHLLEQSPSGCTCICKEIRDIIRNIKIDAPTIRSHGQKVKIVIMTDGEATDGDLADAMRPLKELPVWIVLRLCTDDVKVVEYWNKVDSDLELSMDVLDDLYTEAKKVYGFNPWLNYSEPLHRLRESGCAVRELDLLNEEPLNGDQIRNICLIMYVCNCRFITRFQKMKFALYLYMYVLLVCMYVIYLYVCRFGSTRYKDMPHPDVDFKEFMKTITQADELAEHAWVPMEEMIAYNINKKKLAKHLGQSKCVTM